MSRDSLKGGEEMKMLICGEFLPEYIELCAQAYILTDFVDLVYASAVDDNLRLFGLIGCNYSGKYVDKSSFTCTVVAQHSHQFSWLNLDC